MCNKSVTINIQPLDGIKDVKKDSIEFDKFLKEIGMTNYEMKILPHKYSPIDGCIFCEELYHHRLKASDLIEYLNAPSGEFTIGITDEDISHSVHGVKDWGVLGLAYRGNAYNSCITSTYRLKNRKDLWKLMAHEFIHGYFDMGHCKANDPHCIMQDANKKPNFRIKSSPCKVCIEELKSK